MVICFWTQVKLALCDDCTIFLHFLYYALFSVQKFCGFFSEEICDFGAVFDYSRESARKNSESLGSALDYSMA